MYDVYSRGQELRVINRREKGENSAVVIAYENPEKPTRNARDRAKIDSRLRSVTTSAVATPKRFVTRFRRVLAAKSRFGKKHVRVQWWKTFEL